MNAEVIKVVSVNISEEKGTVKRPTPEIVIDERGILNDAHAGAWHRQVSILSEELIEEFGAQAGRKIKPGEFAENVTIRGIALRSVAILDRFAAGASDSSAGRPAGALELEVTQIGKECHGEACAIFREVGKCVMPKEGIFCRVIHGGKLRAGDSLTHCPKTLSATIITLSDRASRGEYEDRSGPLAEEMLKDFFKGRRWRLRTEKDLLPDSPDLLEQRLHARVEQGADIIITTGGTGVGPRDFTPEVVTPFCDKIIPGVMEHIRAKFGAQKPNALLSRGVAGVRGATLIYALPGSATAVREYMGEILATLEHLLLMVRGLGH